jgi:hypothetical protein
MTDKLKFTSASDKDIYDLLMSAKQRMSEKVLRAIALERGIVFSASTDRHTLCESISQLPHDYKSIVTLIDMRETVARHEKRTFTSLPIALSQSEIEQVIENYRNQAGNEDEITLQSRRSSAFYLNVAYDEVDYSKTRLMQRQRRDAGVEISFENGHTIIRTPSTAKADEVVYAITKEIEKLKVEKISPILISMEGLTPEQRSRFFLFLIRSQPGYELRTVVNMRIASDIDDNDMGGEIDIEADMAAGRDLVGRVNSIALSGTNLLQSIEYQNLKRSGFFITSLTWQSQQRAMPQDILQFDVSFKNGREGTGFRFNARIARRLSTGELTDDFRPLEVQRQPSIWRMMEAAAQDVLAQVRDNPGEPGDAL